MGLSKENGKENGNYYYSTVLLLLSRVYGNIFYADHIGNYGDDGAEKETTI